MTNKITENDYTYVENPNHSLYGVRLLTGNYKDVIYQYGKVSIKESPELDVATLTFTYNINDPGEYDHDKLRKDEKFNNYLGDLLTHIIDAGTTQLAERDTNSRTESST